MAIRDVVTRGYGNGTFSPGVAKIPTRGYSISTVVDILAGQFVSGGVYHPGVMAGEAYLPGLRAGDVYAPGFSEGEAL